MPEQNLAAFPRARSTDLASEAIDSEIVVYDGLSKDAHCLAPLAAAVFTAADGRNSVADIAAIAGKRLGEPVDVASVELALAELDDRGLLESEPGSGVSRRDMLRRTALVGGAALAAPLVASLATPGYGQAASLSSLSYVVVIFQDADGNYYRAKRASDGTVTWNWSDNTPGDSCTASVSGTRLNNPDWKNSVSITETVGSGGVTNVNIFWPAFLPNVTPAKKLYLVDVRIKCANSCHVALENGHINCGSGTCSAQYIGCP
jgi:hypothetical protein